MPDPPTSSVGTTQHQYKQSEETISQEQKWQKHTTSSYVGSPHLQEIGQGMMAQVKSRGAGFKPQLASADSLLTVRACEPVKHRR
jgi:hypothetical protein